MIEDISYYINDDLCHTVIVVAAIMSIIGTEVDSKRANKASTKFHFKTIHIYTQHCCDLFEEAIQIR